MTLKEIFLPSGVQQRLIVRLQSRSIPRQAHANVAKAIEALWLVRNNCPEDQIEQIDYQMETLALNAEGPLIEEHKMWDTEYRDCQVYRVASRSPHDYWCSVTNIPCPVCGCKNTVVWFESGYIPGTRVCVPYPNNVKYNATRFKHWFIVSGNATDPKLIKIPPYLAVEIENDMEEEEEEEDLNEEQELGMSM